MAIIYDNAVLLDFKKYERMIGYIEHQFVDRELTSNEVAIIEKFFIATNEDVYPIMRIYEFICMQGKDKTRAEYCSTVLEDAASKNVYSRFKADYYAERFNIYKEISDLSGNNFRFNDVLESNIDKWCFEDGYTLEQIRNAIERTRSISKKIVIKNPYQYIHGILKNTKLKT